MREISFEVCVTTVSYILKKQLLNQKRKIPPNVGNLSSLL